MRWFSSVFVLVALWYGFILVAVWPQRTNDPILYNLNVQPMSIGFEEGLEFVDNQGFYKE